MVVHLQSNGEKLLHEVMWCHLTNSHVLEENRHENSVNTERLQQQRNLSKQFVGIKANFLWSGSAYVAILGRDM